MDAHGRLCEHAKGTLAAGNQPAHVRPGCGGRQGRQRPDPIGRCEFAAGEPVFRAAIGVGLLTGTARRDPAAQRRELERLGMVAVLEATGIQ